MGTATGSPRFTRWNLKDFTSLHERRTKDNGRGSAVTLLHGFHDSFYQKSQSFCITLLTLYLVYHHLLWIRMPRNLQTIVSESQLNSGKFLPRTHLDRLESDLYEFSNRSVLTFSFESKMHLRKRVEEKDQNAAIIW